MKKNFISMVLGLTISYFSCLAAEAEMPEPYHSIVDLPFDDHGWFANGEQISALMTEKPPVVAIEVGSWLGLSTRFIASHLPEGGKLYAVDTWLGSDEAAHHQDSRLPHIYQIFLSNVKHANLTQTIVPLRMRSLEAARAINVMADFIYIDASHDEENVYQDILAWYAHLNPDGTMCGDDWTWETVRRGVIRAASVLNKRIANQGNFWFFYE